MKHSFLTATCALLLFLGSACNDQSSSNANSSQSASNSSAMMKEGGSDHSDHEDDIDHAAMNQQEHTQMVQPEAVKTFDQVTSQTQQHIQKLTNGYLKVKDALVKESAADAKTASEELLATVKAFNAEKLSGEQQEMYQKKIAELKDDAEHIIGTGDVGHQRDHFATLSKRIYELNKAFDANQSTLYYQHCPMAFSNKGAFWVSAEQEIKNPYFGSKMLKCGSTVETIN